MKKLLVLVAILLGGAYAVRGLRADEHGEQPDDGKEAP